MDVLHHSSMFVWSQIEYVYHATKEIAIALLWDTRNGMKSALMKVD